MAARRFARIAELGLTLVLGFAAGVLALLAFAWLAQAVLARQTQQLDDATLALLRRFSSPALDVLAGLVSLLGSEVVLWLGLALVLVNTHKRRWGAVAGLVVTTTGAQLLNDILKELVHRTRPEPMPMSTGLFAAAQQFSFPSGHAMVSAAFYCYVAYLAWRLVRGWRRWLVVAGLVLLVLAIGLARLYLAAHFLSDVIAGYFAGFVWTDAVVVGGHILTGRSDRRRRARVDHDAPSSAAETLRVS
jgi:undecaprenyl-diphosphatase